MLDTRLRVSELCSLRLTDVWLEDGMLKVTGKGNKERLIPIGKQVQCILWRYVTRDRPEPTNAKFDFVFLTKDGRPLTKDRLEKIMTYYGKKAELKGVRCSPHTLRHSAAVRFLRNGGDVFSLQWMLGHASLEMTRKYCELAEALLDEHPNPTEDEVREALAGNLCRCGNYKRITECVLAAAEMMQGGA